MNSKMINSNNDPKLTLTTHLMELRKRLIISLAALFFGVVVCFFWGQELLSELLMAPLQRLNQSSSQLLLPRVLFSNQIVWAFFALPVILWQGCLIYQPLFQ